MVNVVVFLIGSSPSLTILLLVGMDIWAGFFVFAVSGLAAFFVHKPPTLLGWAARQ